jgi:hypothetical protein
VLTSMCLAKSTVYSKRSAVINVESAPPDTVRIGIQFEINGLLPTPIKPFHRCRRLLTA